MPEPDFVVKSMVSLSELWNTCVPFPATAEYTTRSTPTGTEPSRLFITTDSHYAGTFSSSNCYRAPKKVYKATAIFISVINQLDAQNFCFTISLFQASTCFEHMFSARRKFEIKRMRTALFWVFTQRVVVIPKRRFGSTCMYRLQGQRIKKKIKKRKNR